MTKEEIKVGDEIKVINTGSGVPSSQHTNYVTVMNVIDDCRFFVRPKVGSSYIVHSHQIIKKYLNKKS